MVAFVGRQPELAVLRARLADAASGRPQIVQIQGPAGIGKTALLENFLADAHADPKPVVIFASGEENEQLLAYGVIEQLARAAPGPPTPLATLTAAHLADPIADPVTVGTRFLEFVDQIEAATVIIAVDDAQWADRPSLQALVFALRRVVADNLLTLVTVRDEDITDLPESLTRLINRQANTVLRLRGLDEQDLADLAAALGVENLGSAEARRLRYGTQGNPLHARALLEEFSPTEWGPDEALLPSPRSFRRLVQDRYDSCSAAARRLVDAAAVVGPHVSLQVAATLAGLEDVYPAIDEAVRCELLRSTDAHSQWALAFSHPLVRAAVYDALEPSRRHLLHAAAANLMSDESSRLRHLVAAASGSDDELAGALSRFARIETDRQYWQSAAAHLVSASRLSSDAATAQRWLLEAMVLTILRGDAAAAADLAVEIETQSEGALRDLALGSIAMAADDPAAAERLLSAAWTASGAAGEAEAAGIVALMTGIHWYGRLDAEATIKWCTEALTHFPQNTSTHAVAQTYLIHGLGYAGRTTEAAGVAGAADGSSGNRGQLWLNPRSARGVMRLMEDDFDGAKADLESAAVTASGLGILNTAAFSYAYLARSEWMTGEWDEALLHAERAVAINLESDFNFMQSAVIGIAVLVPAARGEWDAAAGYVRSMVHNESGYERSVVALGMSRARIGEARGEPRAVLAALEPVRRFAVRDAADEPGFWPWQDLYADALVSTESIQDADHFLRAHEELALQRGRRVMVARLARVRARVEAAYGRGMAADRAFQSALDVIDGIEVPFERARIELAAGKVFRHAGQRRRAADLLGAARERFLGLGALPYANRCAQELVASGFDPGRMRSEGPAGLTSQELVVARLAAGGRSNRELADELVVSIKTIEFHLRNIFVKLGISSRRQLPDRLAEMHDGRA